MSPPVLALSGATPQVLESSGAHGAWQLTRSEEERMARLRRSGDRDDFLAAHFLVRVCAARLLGAGPGEISVVQRCSTCGGPHGRPTIAGHPDVGVSLAHSRGVVAAAAGTVPVGVDIEAFPPADEVGVGDLSAALTPAEMLVIGSTRDPRRALLLAWTRKEACLKAGLVGLDGLDGFDLSALPLDLPPVDLAVRSLPRGRWRVHDWWDGRAGAIGALAAPAGAELTLGRA